MEFVKKLVHAGHGSGAIHIIIPEYQHFFAGSYGSLYAVNRLFHILHQPGRMQFRQLRSEISLGCFKCFNSTLHQYIAQGRVYG